MAIGAVLASGAADADTLPPTTWPTVFTTASCAVGAGSTDLIADEPGANGSRDIVGNATFPAMGYTDDGTYLYLRVRVDASPLAGGGSAPLDQFGWGFGLDTDGNTSQYEYAIVTNGITEEVLFVRRSDDTILKVFTPTVGGWVRVDPTGDGSNINGDPDFYLTWAVPFLELISLTAGDPFPLKTGTQRAWVATSANGRTLDKDFMCWDNNQQGDPVLELSVTNPIIIGTYVEILTPAAAASVLPTATITGKAEPGVTVTITIGQNSATVVASANGTWSFAIPASWGLLPGTNALITATVVDDGTGQSATDSVNVRIACVEGTVLVGLTCVLVDNDLDGIGDSEEFILGTDPNDDDTDDDGLTDSAEIGGTIAAAYDPLTDTNPLDADTDDDAISDGDEVLGLGPLFGVGFTDPLDPDSDDDGLADGLEVGVTVGVPSRAADRGQIGYAGTAPGFTPDADPTSTTDPNDDDSDEDGLLDGFEDTNKNGAVTGLTIGGSGTTGAGETDPNDSGTDNDGLLDGIERGLAAPQGQDTVLFVADADPSTTTSPVDTDTDDGGIRDGVEDVGLDGALSLGDRNPNVGADDCASGYVAALSGLVCVNVNECNDPLLNLCDANASCQDTPGAYTCTCNPTYEGNGFTCQPDDLDGDGILNTDEEILGTDPNDADTDGDGLEDDEEIDWTTPADYDPANDTNPLDADTDDDMLSDGDEENGTGPLDPFGPTDPMDSDTDGDGIGDGLEAGVDEPIPPGVSDGGVPYRGTDGEVTPDDDPSTTTDPTKIDTDDDGTPDGVEDTDGNGAVDDDESDPNEPPEPLADLDGDKIADTVDNCPFNPNADQVDADQDGVGDRCDYGDGNETVDRSVSGLALRGGGACSTGAVSTSGGAGMLVLGCLMVAWLLRRRRTGASVTGGAVVAVALGFSGGARAQSGELAVEQFRHVSDKVGILNLSTSKTLGHLGWNVELGVMYAHEPLALVKVGDGDPRADGIVIPGQVRFELIGGIGVFDWMQIDAGIPVVVGVGDAEYGVAGRGASDLTGFAMGDIRVGLGFDVKAMLEKSAQEKWKGFGFGFRVNVWMPTGDTESFNGEGSVRVEPEVSLDYALPGDWKIAANLGYHIRSRSQVFNVVNDDLFRYGIGARGNIGVKGLDALVALSGGVQMAKQRDPLDPSQEVRDGSYNPLEVLVGLGYTIAGFHVVAAGGPGIKEAIGTPDFRVMLQAGYVADGRKDTDGDGLFDHVDQCVNEPEDKDKFEDSDGCPDLDDDKDGILDVVDQCRLEPEDKDKFEDENGCPDPDNDKDGILDVKDECPNDPEDKDGFEDDNGCPDPDNDKDGVLDLSDKCAMEPEDKDQFEDEDGCPEPGPCEKGADGQCLAEEKNGAIEIYERVEFETNKAVIRPVSFPVLDAVITILKKKDRIKKVEVQGHTDSDGPTKRNQTLSEKRALSVVNYLVEKGDIDVERLTFVGHGESKPIESNKTKDGKQKNRRVQFVILDPKPDGSIREKSPEK